MTLPATKIESSNINELKLHAALMDVDVQTRELFSNVILITYDIPNTKDGAKARSTFLRDARRLGAAQHSESVYFMPWTFQTNLLITELSATKGGKVYTWHSQVEDERQIATLAIQYDTMIDSAIDALNERIAKIRTHLDKERFRVASKMIDRSLSALSDLELIVNNRNSERLQKDLKDVKRELAHVTLVCAYLM